MPWSDFAADTVALLENSILISDESSHKTLQIMPIILPLDFRYPTKNPLWWDIYTISRFYLDWSFIWYQSINFLYQLSSALKIKMNESQSRKLSGENSQ